MDDNNKIGKGANFTVGKWPRIFRNNGILTVSSGLVMQLVTEVYLNYSKDKSMLLPNLKSQFLGQLREP
jgi:hypothetical protein